MLRFILLWTIVWFVGGVVASPFPVKKIGIEQGLTSNYVLGVSQDKQGFMWFATESGLNRFDGHRIRTFKKADAPANSISANELNQVLADPIDDIIWIATQRNGLNAFNTKTEQFTQYLSDGNNPHSIATNDVTNLAPAADGNLWLSTYHFGVEYFEKSSQKFTHFNQSTIPGFASNHVWSIADDKNGSLYIGHVFNGLSIMSLRDHSIKNFRYNAADPTGLPGDEVFCIYFDSKGNVWIGTNNGLALFNRQTERFTVFSADDKRPFSLSDNHVHSISEWNNALWIGTGQNVSILNLQNFDPSNPQSVKFNQLVMKDDESGLSNSVIKNVFTDSFNNLWISTYGGGVNFLSSKPRFFNTLSYSPYRSADNSLSNKIVSDLCFDGAKLWVATGEKGIDVFENGIKLINFNKDKGTLPDNNIVSAFKDSKGLLWFGTANGYIIRFNPKTNQYVEITDIPTKGIGVYCFFEDMDNQLWIGTNRGLYQYDWAKRQVKTFNVENSQLPDNVIRSISQDDKGRMWVGTFGQGLTVFEKNFSLVRSFNTYLGFPSNAINHILRDSKDRMWIATWEGMVLFNSCEDDKYQVFTVKNGLADASIAAIEEGLSNDIWLSTNAGISHFNASNHTFQNYNHLDGIPMGNFLAGSVIKAFDGTIYFGSVNGLCYFNSNQKPVKFDLPSASITAFVCFDKEVTRHSNLINIPIDEKIVLTHNQNTFSINYNVLDFSINDQTEYAYMLKGLENSWENVGNIKEVTFRNIPPGNYEFQLKARLRNQDWGEEITTIQIIITPPLWLTWWAKALYVIAIILTIMFFIRTYKRKLKLENSLYLVQKEHQQEHELNNERLSFYTNIAHELRTPLTLIMGPLEDLTNEANMPQAYVKKIGLIHRSATRLLNLINQILEFRKTETHNRKLCVIKDDISVLVKEICNKYEGLNQNPLLVFKTVVETNQTHLYFDPEVITIILDNLISNALKYTKKGEISIAIRQVTEHDSNYTEIEVRDTGMGISPDHQSKIFDRYFQIKNNHHISGSGIGLSLVKNLTEIHQATITVESKPSEGSSFKLRLKTNNTYNDTLHAESADEAMEYEEQSNSKPIMLVIEDNVEIREYIAEIFTDSFDLMQAENGKEGVDLAFKRIPDIIISDIMMPVMDGIEACRLLKEDLRTTHIPIILLTAKDTLQDKTDGYNTGADSYITKPFSAGLLHSRVKNLIESRKKLAATFTSSPLQKQTIVTEALHQLDQEFLDKVIAIVEENLSSENISIGFIAGRLNMSNSTFYRKIKALTNQSPNEFIRKIKMHHAEKLLLTGKYTVSEIIFHVGINSSAYFRQCFKDEFGLTPTDYLKQFKK
jgi:signal transduction histidine kinase/ligand-binding sensor domain-containing protein/DNA-binding response OmpR family regulator